MLEIVDDKDVLNESNLKETRLRREEEEYLQSVKNTKHIDRECYLCGSIKTKVYNGHPAWYKYKTRKDGKYDKNGKWDGKNYICSACYAADGKERNILLVRNDFETRLEYANVVAQKLGFKDEAERFKIYRHKTGRQRPMEDAPDCPEYFGICIGEKYVSQVFEESKPMPYGTPGYDWEWEGFKVQHKARCLNTLGIPRYFRFTRLDYNKIADKFVLSGWDDRDNLNPLHIWVFDKDDIMPDGLPFWNRNELKIYNTSGGLAEFAKYEDIERLNKLKEKLQLSVMTNK